MKHLPLLTFLIFTLVSCGEKAGSSVKTFTNSTDSTRLFQLIDSVNAFQEKEFPNYREAGIDLKLPSMKEEDILRRGEYYKSILVQLDSIDYGGLSNENQVNFDLFKYTITDHVEELKYRSYLNPILVDAGFHIGFAFTPSRFNFSKKEDYEKYISLLKSYVQYTDEHIDLMKKGLKAGISQPKVILEGYEITFDQHIVEDVEKSIFYKPFMNIPSQLAEVDRQQLTEEGKKAVMDFVVPAYQKFSAFMKNEFIPNTKTSIGASEIPNGKNYYQSRLDYFTTLGLSADSIHKLGLSEVARIEEEMKEILNHLNYNGSLQDFIQFLRTDPRFYPKSGEELLKEASFIAKKMDGKLPSLFRKLPRQPYTVNPVPDHLAPKYTGGRYVGASLESSNPGQYWVNTYALESRPLYVLEALTLHEAVPGHHLQGALSKELDHLPEFRRRLYISAYGEGWGLYSEYLGKEVGFYADPYSNFGRLTYEMWRACRLVVDTGIHAFGWTRQQAMDYLAKYTALSLHEIRTETDRYISWPGQAVSYKIGELKIKSLRKKAETALGDKFDVREFHDMILSEGAVILPVLEKMTEEFIEAR